MNSTSLIQFILAGFYSTCFSLPGDGDKALKHVGVLTNCMIMYVYIWLV